MDKKIIFVDNYKNARIYALTFRNTLNEIIKIHNLSAPLSFIVGKIAMLSNIFSTLLLKNQEDQLLIDVELNKDNFTKIFITKSGIFKIMVKDPSQSGKLEDLFNDHGIIKFLRRLKGYKDDLETIIKKNSSVIEQNFANYFYDTGDSNILIKSDIKYNFNDNNFDIAEAGAIVVIPYPHVHSNYLNFLYFLSNDKINILDSINNDPAKIIKNFFGNIEGNILNEENIFLKCDCSYEFALNIIKLLKKEELVLYMEKKENPIIKCLFCNREYSVKFEDLIKIANEKKNKT
ncbi:MAG: Hsp33 family molecular chaperone HslO [Spirochaetes bacterium]|nr:Hsp33 family molecular chaperone HslO [Spirochaetota bacterium]